MLAGGDGALYRSMLAGGGGELFTRVEVWSKAGGTWVRIDPFGDDGLPLSSGSLSATLQNRVTRTVRLSVPLTDPRYRNGASMVPFAQGDLLDPLASELRIWCGWRSGASTFGPWPVFTGPIMSVSASSGSGEISVDASDRAEPVVSCGFIEPRSAPVGISVVDAAIDLISDVWGVDCMGTYEDTFASVPTMTWDHDRGAALDALMGATVSYWFANADGTFTFKVIPWSRPSYGTPVVTFDIFSGLNDAQVSLSRTNVYSACVVPAGNVDGTAPSVGISYDTDPTSRTWVDGPLGRRVLRGKSEKIDSPGKAKTLADAQRARSVAGIETWSADVAIDPSLELGDVCEIATMGVYRTMSLSRFSYDFSGGSTMNTSWRTAGGEVA